MVLNNSLNLLYEQKGFTPLHVCAKYGAAEVARALLVPSCGADPDASARNGLTPMHVAAHYAHTGVARVLLAHGAEPQRAAQVWLA